MSKIFWILSSYVLLTAGMQVLAEVKEPDADWKKSHQQLQEKRRAALSRLNEQVVENPDDIQVRSRRGDLHFFLGDFKAAVADYDKMLELSSELERSHWRRGIALFYAGRYEEAAAQFDRYHSFDNVDRENGIWRYLSHHRAFGKEKARKELLKYEKDDREPFPSVYKLFAGEITPEQILKEIAEAKISDEDREVRMFYATLYIGLNHVVEGNPDEARKSLAKMLSNPWGPEASYGPNYMWEVGRLQWELLQKKKTD